MIFLSHNYKDKPVIEQVALKLSAIYGQQNVFYDSWSIQPGDGIIDKMEEGLTICKFFFFFVSVNSLQSNMESRLHPFTMSLSSSIYPKVGLFSNHTVTRL